MVQTFYAEAFGTFARHDRGPDHAADDDDLYIVFHGRAEQLGWSDASWGSTDARGVPRPNGGRPPLWGMNDAALGDGTDAPRIGWVQVGLNGGPPEAIPFEPPTEPGWAAFPIPAAPGGDPVVAIPPFVHCFDDALRRFGTADVSALQLTATNLWSGIPPYPNPLLNAHSWFDRAKGPSVAATVVVDTVPPVALTEVELLVALSQWEGAFEFGRLEAGAERRAIEWPAAHAWGVVEKRAQFGLGVTVRLPDWSADAIAWVMARTVAAVRASSDVQHFTIRITRR